MNVLGKMSFVVVATGLLFGSQNVSTRAADKTSGSSGSTPASGSPVTTGLSENMAQTNSGLIQANRKAIHGDRSNILNDQSAIEKSRQDIRAAEFDIQIHPMNKSADEARISADGNSIKNDHRDLMKNEHNLRQDQHLLRSAMIHHHPNTGVANPTFVNVERPLYNNGFFPPTRRPSENQEGLRGFGGESHLEHEHDHEHHRVR